MDPRFEKLADVLIGYSTELKEGEKVLIEAFDIPPEMVVALIRRATEAGGIPLVTVKQNLILRDLFMQATEEQMKLIGDCEKYRMEKMDAYIALRGSHNISETSDVPQDRMKEYQSHWLKPVHLEVRVPRTKWVVLRWPTPSMAQQAGMSTEAFEKFYFDVCTLDYSKMDSALQPLKELMERTDMVRIKGPQDTDIEFSIRDIPAVPCAGKLNIPDGEIFTAPVKESVNGVIHYNTATLYQGQTFENVRLEFKEGKVVDATSSDTKRLNEILDSDDGSRFVGEFALGVNPFIDNAMKSSTRRSRGRCTSRQATPTTRPTTATAARCTGTWCSSRPSSTAAARSTSTMCWCARTASSSSTSSRPSTRRTSSRVLVILRPAASC
jgi:aminopeptidase